MPEGGLSASEVGKEIAGHAKTHAGGREWVISAVEAILLATVAVLAAWSGYSSAKWNTESRLVLVEASAARTQASTAELAAMTQRNFDSSTFTAWFVAYVADDASKMKVAEHRFTPNFHRAFVAWEATDPESNPHSPPGPTYMPQYREPEAVHAAALTARSAALNAQGSLDGSRSDDYVRLTVYLATVLFLIAISSQFKIRSIRVALTCFGVAVLAFALVQLAGLPAPPA